MDKLGDRFSAIDISAICLGTYFNNEGGLSVLYFGNTDLGISHLKIPSIGDNVGAIPVDIVHLVVSCCRSLLELVL
jgi:hypothetical protein